MVLGMNKKSLSHTGVATASSKLRTVPSVGTTASCALVPAAQSRDDASNSVSTELCTFGLMGKMLRNRRTRGIFPILWFLLGHQLCFFLGINGYLLEIHNYETNRDDGDDRMMAAVSDRPNRQRPVAILHVGVHKTATSTIQHALYGEVSKENGTTTNPERSFLVRNNVHPVRILAAPLCNGEGVGGEEDGLRPDDWNTQNGATTTTTVGVENCRKARDYVDSSLNRTSFLQTMEEHASKGEGVIVSNEFLGVIRRGGCSTVVWDRLRSAFSGYETTVVVGYRRYFEWVLSYYHQQAWVSHDVARRTFPDFAGDDGEELASSRWRAPFHSVHPAKAELELYRSEGFGNAVVFNMHDRTPDGTIVSDFLCAADRGGSLCGRARRELSRKGGGEGGRVENRFEHGEEYYYLSAVLLERMGRIDCWWDEDCIETVTRRIRRFNRDDLGQTVLDLPRACLSDDRASRLLEASLRFEKDLLPDWYASPGGERAHREEFGSYLGEGKFCSLDARKVLDSPAWRDRSEGFVPPQGRSDF